jgi:acyl-homoserine lactone acylase PvdQ
MNLKEIEEMLEGKIFFPLNVLYATSDGDIGYQLCGLFPKRKY